MFRPGYCILFLQSYCCGQNRGITDCLLWSDIRTLGHHFSQFHAGWRAGGFVCVCLLSTWVAALDKVLLEALKLCWSRHQLPFVLPCSESCLWTTSLDLSAHCCSSHVNLRPIFDCKLGDFPDDHMRGKWLNQCSEAECLNSSELN